MSGRTIGTAALALALACNAGAAQADGSASAALSESATAAFDLVRSYYAADDLPLDAKTLARETLGDTVRETVEFRGFDREMITAYLAKPAGVAKPPVVIALHGITQSKDQWWRDGGPWSFPSRHREALLDGGIAVVAIDVRNHGDRILANDFDNPYVYLEKRYYEGVRKMVVESALDVRRAIDYLETRADVDHARLGVAGFSLGAHIGWIATAVDPRIDRSLIMAMPFLPNGPGQSRSFAAPRIYLPGLKDRHIMLLAATEDDFYSPAQVAQTFEAIPTATKELKWIDGGHDLPASTAQFSTYWFVGKL